MTALDKFLELDQQRHIAYKNLKSDQVKFWLPHVSTQENPPNHFRLAHGCIFEVYQRTSELLPMRTFWDTRSCCASWPHCAECQNFQKKCVYDDLILLLVLLEQNGATWLNCKKSPCEFCKAINSRYKK